MSIPAGSLVRYKRKLYLLQYELDEDSLDATLIDEHGREREVAQKDLGRIEPLEMDARMRFLSRLILSTREHANLAMQRADHHPDPIFGY